MATSQPPSGGSLLSKSVSKGSEASKGPETSKAPSASRTPEASKGPETLKGPSASEGPQISRGPSILKIHSTTPSVAAKAVCKNPKLPSVLRNSRLLSRKPRGPGTDEGLVVNFIKATHLHLRELIKTKYNYTYKEKIHQENVAMLNEIIDNIMDRIAQVVKTAASKKGNPVFEGLTKWFCTQMHAIAVTNVTANTKVEVREKNGTRASFPYMAPTIMEISRLNDLTKIVVLDWRAGSGGTEQAPHEHVVGYSGIGSFRPESGRPVLHVKLLNNTDKMVLIMVDWFGPYKNVPGMPELTWEEIMKDVFDVEDKSKTSVIAKGSGNTSVESGTMSVRPVSQTSSVCPQLSKLSESKLSTPVSKMSEAPTK